MANRSRYFAQGALAGQIGDLIDVTPDDGADIPTDRDVVGLVSTSGGVAKVHTLLGGDQIRTVTLVPGVPFVLFVTRVLATDTTATGIQALVQ